MISRKVLSEELLSEIWMIQMLLANPVSERGNIHWFQSRYRASGPKITGPYIPEVSNWDDGRKPDIFFFRYRHFEEINLNYAHNPKLLCRTSILLDDDKDHNYMYAEFSKKEFVNFTNVDAVQLLEML